ncbi:MAG TPA: glycosyltransferase family 9 protein [bacterium]|nr:glycosyltransferase family 9 protein [bacterium]
MLDNKLQKTLFHLTSQLTTYFPRGGAWFFDHTIPHLLGNPFLVDLVARQNLERIRKVKKFERILVIPDIHIGDAVMLQGAVYAFRAHFPDARIDFVIKKSVACLIEGNPVISNLYPLFTGVVFPEPADIESVKELVAENRYDLCFNCSPFFEDDSLFPPGQAILNFMTVAPRLIRNGLDRTGINHFLHQSYSFPDKLLRSSRNTFASRAFRGVDVFLSDGALRTAEQWLQASGIRPGKPLFFLNPDTASPYTLIPEHYQVELLKRVLRMDVEVLLGTAFTHKNIEQRILEGLDPQERRRVVLVPTSLPIDAYTALIDKADVFVTGDTGPLHIAAARKRSKSGNSEFRNRTFVVSVFGATPAHMSGYDSTDPLFPPANQDAPSRTFVSESPCRNITCVNKMAKTCQKVRCYDRLDVEGMAGEISDYLEKTKA